MYLEQLPAWSIVLTVRFGEARVRSWNWELGNVYEQGRGVMRSWRKQEHFRTSAERGRRRGGLFMAALLVLSACTGGGTDGRSGNGDKSLIIASAGLPAGLDPHVTSDPHMWDILGQTYASAVRLPRRPVNGQEGVKEEYFEEGRFDPWLVESYELADDNTSLTFHLREGVESPYGNELTAEDVKWTVERAFATEAIGFFFVGTMGLTSPDEVEVVDEYTVRFTPPEPAALLLDLWANEFLAILDSTEMQEHATEDDPWAGEWLSRNSAGFGPYYVTNWVSGDRIEMSANPNYFQGPPQFDSIVYLEVPSSSSRVQLLQEGSVHIAQDLTPNEMARLENSDAARIVNVPANYVTFIRYNPEFEPFENELVRQALNWATPQQEIIDSVFRGRYATPLKSVVTTTSSDYTDEFYNYDFDLDQARDLLAEAGYADGFSTTLSINEGIAGSAEIARILRDAWGQIGVEVNIEALPSGSFTTQLINGEFALSIARDMALLPDSLYFMSIFLSSGSIGVANYSNYDNARVTELIDEAVTTIDREERHQIALEIQEIAVQEDPAWVFLVEPGYQTALRNDVSNFIWTFLDTFPADELVIEER